MAQARFEGAFHQSTANQYLSCPKSLYYRDVLGLDREKISITALAGRAGHEALEITAHGQGIWEIDSVFDHFRLVFEAEQARSIEQGMEVHGVIDMDKYKKMLSGYLSQDYNRESKMILCEAEFLFSIQPAKAVYQFAGRIDQLRQTPTVIMKRRFPLIFANVDPAEKPFLIGHVDTKFGQKRETSAFELALNRQIDVYAYAVKEGTFTRRDKSEVTPNLIPDYHALYFLADHVPYADDGGTFKKDESGNHVPCDIWVRLGMPGPCLVGVKQQPCKGLRSYCTKQVRGPAMYFTTRPQRRLDQIPKELGEVCAPIRLSCFPRHQNELCFTYCQYRSVCEAEIMAELA